MSQRPRTLLSLTSAAALAVLLGACSAPAPSGPDPVEPQPTEPTSSCPSPLPTGGYGPAVLLDSAELLGASDLPDGVCAYASEAGTSIWILGESYDENFPERIAAWLEPLGWTAEERGTWGEGDLKNFAYLPPAGVDIATAFAHAFTAYPESVSFNMGIDQEFLSHYGVEPGDELSIFAAWS